MRGYSHSVNNNWWIILIVLDRIARKVFNGWPLSKYSKCHLICLCIVSPFLPQNTVDIQYKSYVCNSKGGRNKCFKKLNMNVKNVLTFLFLLKLTNSEFFVFDQLLSDEGTFMSLLSWCPFLIFTLIDERANQKVWSNNADKDN